MNTSTISKNNQVTVPRAVRERLGLKPGDKIIYEIEGDSIILKAQPSALSAFGSLKIPDEMKGKTFKEEREGARAAWVKSAIK
jgi:AbrB family looped-hinge helix DNA binding protein